MRVLDDLTYDDDLLVEAVVNNPNITFLEVQVQDTGIGISEKDMPKLFKLFGLLDSTKHLNTKGIGLGLHIMKKLIKMFDGDIICRSKEGFGSNFIFIVGLGQDDEVTSNEQVTNIRIKNPIIKHYQKIVIFDINDDIKS